QQKTPLRLESVTEPAENVHQLTATGACHHQQPGGDHQVKSLSVLQRERRLHSIPRIPVSGVAPSKLDRLVRKVGADHLRSSFGQPAGDPSHSAADVQNLEAGDAGKSPLQLFKLLGVIKLVEPIVLPEGDRESIALLGLRVPVGGGAIKLFPPGAVLEFLDPSGEL